MVRSIKLMVKFNETLRVIDAVDEEAIRHVVARSIVSIFMYVVQHIFSALGIPSSYNYLSQVAPMIKIAFRLVDIMLIMVAVMVVTQLLVLAFNMLLKGRGGLY